jgi:hypothetical protein
MFSDHVMGHSFTVPDEELRQVYNTQYFIFEEIIFGGK